MNKKLLITIIAIVIVVILVAFWLWKEEKQDRVQPTEQTQNVEINDNVENVEQESNRTGDAEKGYESTGKIEGEYFLVSELGIKFKADKDLREELVYFYESPNNNHWSGIRSESILFSTKSLVDLNCLAKDSPLGAITKISGKIEDYKDYTEYNFENYIGLTQFNDFFVLYTSPQAPCTLEPTSSNNFNKVEKPQLEEFSKSISAGMETIN